MFLSTFNIIKFTVQMLAKAQMAFFHFIYFSSFDFCLLMLIKPNRDVRHWNGESNHISTYIFIFIYIIRLRKILSCHFFVCILFYFSYILWLVGCVCVSSFIWLRKERAWWKLCDNLQLNLCSVYLVYQLDNGK